MNKKLQHTLITVGLIALTIFVVKRCEDEPKIKIETVYVKKTDTVRETIIEEKWKDRYFTKYKTVKGKDSIVFVDRLIPGDSTILEAREYSTTVKGDSVKALLKITTTGELLDVQGIFEYDQKQTTITKIKPKSGLFLYAETSFKPVLERFEVGVDYQLRNKIIVGISASYHNQIKEVVLSAKLGYKIF